MASLPSTPDGSRPLEFFHGQRRDRNDPATRIVKPESERRFACTTRYAKSHATMTWEIRDVSARDTHGERLRSAEFVVGQGTDRTAWIILCNFGTQNYEDYVSAHVKLVTKASQVCADVELSIVGACGNKVNTETKTARIFSNVEGDNDSAANNESTWGYFSFAKRADLRFNPEWVPNDTLTLAGRVSVYGDDETCSSLNSDSAVEEDPHIQSLADDLTTLFVEAQSDPVDDGVGDGNVDGERENAVTDIVVIATPGKWFKVHRSVLSARSLVFRRMLQRLETTAPPPPPPHHQHQPPVSGNATAAVNSNVGRSSCLPTFLSSISTAAATNASVSSPVNDPPSSTPVSSNGASSSSASSSSSTPWTESGSGCVWIPDVNEDVMRHFLLYLYGSRVPLEMDEQLAEELLVVADKYDVERLKNACEKALGGSMSDANVPRLLVVADRHRCSKLKANALSYLTHNPVQILSSAEWKLVEENHPSLVAEALRAMALRG